MKKSFAKLYVLFNKLEHSKRLVYSFFCSTFNPVFLTYYQCITNFLDASIASDTHKNIKHYKKTHNKTAKFFYCYNHKYIIVFFFSFLFLFFVAIFSKSSLMTFLIDSSFYQTINFSQSQNNSFYFQSVSFSHDPMSTHFDQDFLLKIAISAYSIKIPEHIQYVKFNKDLMDRGMIIGDWSNKNAKIYIGQPAFSSWAILGSTIAHEAEVHGSQSFLAIGLLDLIFNRGIISAETVAYNYEISNSKRFGLSKKEIAEIEHTKNHHFPNDNQKSFFGTMLMSVAQ